MSSILRVLVVDDDEVDRQIVKRAFRKTRFDVDITEAQDAETALAALAAAGDEGFDLGVFDLRLPGRDGRELLEALRERGDDLPVIMLTGQGSEETAVEIMKSGAGDYLAKGSLTPERLSRSVRHVLRLTAAERAQREAQRALAESEASFRRLAESLPDSVIRLDADERVAYANATPPWRSGLEAPEALLGRTLEEIGADAPDVVPRLTTHLRQALDGEANSVTVYVPLHEDVSLEERDALVAIDPEAHPPERREVPRWLEVRFVPEWTAVGSRRTVLAVARDVTAQRQRREEERRRAEIERQLIGIVSHDLKNPIGAILMSASILGRKLRGAELEAAVAQPLDILQRSGRRARRMVNDLLDFTRARLGGGIPMNPTRIDLAEVVRGVLEELRAAHPGRALELDIDGEVAGYFDGDRVAQALTNLASNALTYSRPSEPVQVRLATTSTTVTLSVTNRGDTIPPDVLPRLFKPFQRGESEIGDQGATRSVGLGLFIVEQIVRGHRGRIEVESADGVTTFHVILPRRRPSGQMEALPAPSP